MAQTFRLEPNRRKRLRALAAKLRRKLPNDPKAQKLTRNWGRPQRGTWNAAYTR
jgi:hypothetical protein